MTPTTFKEANTTFGPPEGYAEEQVHSIQAFVGQVKTGSVDGANQIITAWQPSVQDIENMIAGKPIYLSCLGVLPPHFLTTDFEQARNPA
jgi:hypothetical protein